MLVGIVARKISSTILLGAGLLAMSCVAASAQQTTGVPGSPDATTTIDGKQLPPPDPKFGGVIKENALQNPPPTEFPERTSN
jgi:arylsulfatase